MSAETISYPSSSTPHITSPQLIEKGTQEVITTPSSNDLATGTPKTVSLVKDTPRLEEQDHLSSYGDVLKSIISMIEAMIQTQISRTENDGKQSQIQSRLADILRKNTDEATKNQLKQIDETQAKIEQQQRASFWMKVFGWVVSALLIVVTLGTAGPVAAAIMAAMVILEQTGVLDKIFEKIENPALRAVAKIAFIAAVAVASGGISTAADGLLSLVTTSLAKGAVEGVEAGAQQAIEAAVKESVETAIEESAEAASESSTEEAGSSSFKMVATQVGVQQTLSLNVVQDILTALLSPGKDDEKKKEIIAWISMAINIVLSLCSLKLTINTGCTTGTQIASNLEKAAKNSMNIAIRFASQFVTRLMKTGAQMTSILEKMIQSGAKTGSQLFAQLLLQLMRAGPQITPMSAKVVQAAMEEIAQFVATLVVKLIQITILNPQLGHKLMIAAQGGEDGAGIAKGTIDIQRAELFEEVGLTKADLVMLQAISEALQSWTKQTASEASSRAEEYNANVRQWNGLVQSTAVAAQILA